jgi:hypothetical protein
MGIRWAGQRGREVLLGGVTDGEEEGVGFFFGELGGGHGDCRASIERCKAVLYAGGSKGLEGKYKYKYE